jgi:hypothetical protein
MAKITDQDVTLTFGQLVELRADGWISEETGDDVVVALAKASDEVERGGTGEVEIIDPATLDGMIAFALRRKCECGNWRTLCHGDA